VEVPTLGARGQGWVWLQFALIAGIVGAGLLPPAWPAGVARLLDVVGAALALGGAGLAVWAVRALGRSLTPYPAPPARATLVDGGPYGWVRHPIYAAGLALLGGYSLVASPCALVLTVVLGIVWALKASVEERFLRARFGGYEGYAERVRHRLVPGLY
jgi:protein-S-isoprenylcysteine O-methyltransferase Ste14